MSIKASIDIGSNSILLLIIDFSKSPFVVLENHSRVTGLGRDLDKNSVFIPEAMSDSFSVLDGYAGVCQVHGIDPADVIVTATEASRVAKNAKDFFKKILNETGLNVQTITGEAEAYYSTTGILIDENISEDEICIMDIGGASTELIKVNVPEKRILHSFSMPVGAVRMNNWQAQGNRDENFHKVLAEYSNDIDKVLCKKLYCVAGTMTSVGNMYLENKEWVEDEVHGLSFKTTDLINLKNKTKDYNVEDYLKDYPFLGKRSKTIKSGLVLAEGILKRLGVEDLYISTFGLRYGSIMEESIPDKFLT